MPEYDDGRVAVIVGPARPADAASCGHRDAGSGKGTHWLAVRRSYSTTIARPPGRRWSTSLDSTRSGSRTKCRALASSMPSSCACPRTNPGNARGSVKSAFTAITRASSEGDDESSRSARTARASSSTANTVLPAPSTAGSAFVNVPVPAPRSAHTPPRPPTASRISSIASESFIERGGLLDPWHGCSFEGGKEVPHGDASCTDVERDRAERHEGELSLRAGDARRHRSRWARP